MLNYYQSVFNRTYTERSLMYDRLTARIAVSPSASAASTSVSSSHSEESQMALDLVETQFVLAKALHAAAAMRADEANTPHTPPEVPSTPSGRACSPTEATANSSFIKTPLTADATYLPLISSDRGLPSSQASSAGTDGRDTTPPSLPVSSPGACVPDITPALDEMVAQSTTTAAQVLNKKSIAAAKRAATRKKNAMERNKSGQAEGTSQTAADTEHNEGRGARVRRPAAITIDNPEYVT